MKIYRSVLLVAVAGGATLGGCDNLPPLEQGPAVSTTQIVERIRCELAEATKPYLGTNSDGKVAYPWFQKWTAFVDLTLVVADVTSASPSFNIVDPLKSAVLPGVGSIPRNVTVAINAGVSASASRTEQMSFIIGLADLKDELNKPVCSALAHDRDFNDNLGLSEWIKSAFEPIISGDLKPGAQKYQSPKALTKVQPPAPAPSPPKPFAVASFFVQNKEALKNILGAKPLAPQSEILSQDFRNLRFNKEDLEKALASRDDGNPLAVLMFKVVRSLPNPNATLADFVKASEDFVYHQDDYKGEKLTRKLNSYVSIIKDLKANLRYIHDHADDPALKIRNDLDSYVNAHGLLGEIRLSEYMTNFYSDLDAAQTWANGLLPKKSDPGSAGPVEVIEHSVEFDVALTGGVGPNWTLTRFKGPNVSGNLFAGSRTRKHGLVITMGDPTSQTVDNSRSTASLAAALRSSGISITP